MANEDKVQGKQVDTIDLRNLPRFDVEGEGTLIIKLPENNDKKA